MEPKSAPQVLPALPKGFVQEFIEWLNKYEILDLIITFIKVGSRKTYYESILRYNNYYNPFFISGVEIKPIFDSTQS